MKFVATRHEPDGHYGETIDAKDWADAERICAEKGWNLDGQLVQTIPFEQTSIAEMDALIARRNSGQLDA